MGSGSEDTSSELTQGEPDWPVNTMIPTLANLLDEHDNQEEGDDSKDAETLVQCHIPETVEHYLVEWQTIILGL